MPLNDPGWHWITLLISVSLTLTLFVSVREKERNFEKNFKLFKVFKQFKLFHMIQMPSHFSYSSTNLDYVYLHFPLFTFIYLWLPLFTFVKMMHLWTNFVLVRLSSFVRLPPFFLSNLYLTILGMVGDHPWGDRWPILWWWVTIPGMEDD